MSFDEFLNNCSFDISDSGKGTQSIVCIFSSGFLKEYSKNFVKDNEDVAKMLVASDLYDYLNKEFNNGDCD